MAKTSKKTESAEPIHAEAAVEAPDSSVEAPEPAPVDESLSDLAAAEEQAVAAAAEDSAPKEPAPVVPPPAFDDSWMSEVETLGTYRVTSDGAFVGEHGLVHRLAAGAIVSSTTHDLAAIRASGVALERISD